MIPGFLPIAFMSRPRGGISLSGGSHSVTSNVNPTTASFKWDNDGKFYKRINTGSYTQVGSTDWILPFTDAPGTYQIRYTNLTGDTAAFTCNAAAEDVWVALTGDFICTVTDTTPLVSASQLCTFDIEIRDGTGPTIDSASYTLFANYDSTA